MSTRAANLSDEAMEKAMHEAINRNKNELKLTKEEEQRLVDAMQKKEFRDLLAEYVDELSDPQTRKEQEMYIAQLEAEQKVPEGKELLRPSAGFVVKCRLQQDQSKLFINICHSNKIDEAQATSTKGGVQWNLPFSLGPARMERDKKKDNIPTYDICFHSRIVLQSLQSAPLRKMICSTAMEHVEHMIAKQDSCKDIKLSPEYHILRGVKYKNGEPAVMLLGKKSPETLKQQCVPSGKSPTVTSQSSSAVDPVQNIQPQKTKQKCQSISDDPLISSENSSISSNRPDLTLKERTLDVAQRSLALPQLSYRLVERGFVDLADFTESKPNATCLSSAAPRQRPSQLIVKIDLPMIASIAKVDLDVSEQQVVLQSIDGAFAPLTVRLSYPVVIDEKTVARFDKGRKLLTVALAVKKAVRPSSPAALCEIASTERSQIDADPTIETQEQPIITNAQTMHEKLDDSGSESRKTQWKSRQPRNPHNRWVEGNGLPVETLKPSDTTRNASIMQVKVDSVTLDKKISEVKGVGSAAEHPAAKSAQSSLAQELTILSPAVGESSLTLPLSDSRISVDKGQDGPLKEPEHGLQAAKIPKYIYRQNKKSVTLLVDVANIDKGSVVAEWSLSSIKVAFRSHACAENSGSVDHYNLSLKLWGSIQSECSRFDVASKNMAIVLRKAVSHEDWWPKLTAEESVEPSLCRQSHQHSLSPSSKASKSSNHSTKGDQSLGNRPAVLESSRHSLLCPAVSDIAKSIDTANSGFSEPDTTLVNQISSSYNHQEATTEPRKEVPSGLVSVTQSPIAGDVIPITSHRHPVTFKNAIMYELD